MSWRRSGAGGTDARAAQEQPVLTGSFTASSIRAHDHHAAATSVGESSPPARTLPERRIVHRWEMQPSTPTRLSPNKDLGGRMKAIASSRVRFRSMRDGNANSAGYNTFGTAISFVPGRQLGHGEAGNMICSRGRRHAGFLGIGSATSSRRTTYSKGNTALLRLQLGGANSVDFARRTNSERTRVSTRSAIDRVRHDKTARSIRGNRVEVISMQSSGGGRSTPPGGRKHFDLRRLRPHRRRQASGSNVGKQAVNSKHPRLQLTRVQDRGPLDRVWTWNSKITGNRRDRTNAFQEYKTGVRGDLGGPLDGSMAHSLQLHQGDAGD